MGNTKILMILAIAAVGLFAMPNLLATYAGTHTIVDNDPGKIGPSGKALDCMECHQYIADAAILNTNSNDIYTKHKVAADDKDYTTYLAYYGNDMTTNISDLGKTVVRGSNTTANYDLYFTARSNQSKGLVLYGDILGRLNGTSSSTAVWQVVNDNGAGVRNTTADQVDAIGGKPWSACLFCHRSAFFYGGTHTRLQVRGCTNQWCHGNGATPEGTSSLNPRPAGVSYMGDIPSKQIPQTTGGANGSLDGYSKSALTGKSLNKTSDAHNKWFDASALQADSYQNPMTGENYTKDYYTCMGCHTHADVKLDITKSTGFNATIRSVAVESISVTYTISANTTQLQSYKEGAAFKP